MIVFPIISSRPIRSWSITLICEKIQRVIQKIIQKVSQKVIQKLFKKFFMNFWSNILQSHVTWFLLKESLILKIYKRISSTNLQVLSDGNLTFEFEHFTKEWIEFVSDVSFFGGELFGSQLYDQIGIRFPVRITWGEIFCTRDVHSNLGKKRSVIFCPFG